MIASDQFIVLQSQAQSLAATRYNVMNVSTGRQQTLDFGEVLPMSNYISGHWRLIERNAYPLNRVFLYDLQANRAFKLTDPHKPSLPCFKAQIVHAIVYWHCYDEQRDERYIYWGEIPDTPSMASTPTLPDTQSKALPDGDIILTGFSLDASRERHNHIWRFDPITRKLTHNE